MTDKPKPNPKTIVSKLRRMLYGGRATPADNDYAPCRTMLVSYPGFAKICGYPEPKDIPDELLDQVYEAALEKKLIVGCGYYTVLVGGDFHCDCDPQSLYPDYGFETEVLPKPAPESEPPAETDKPTPKPTPEKIALALRHMLYGKDNPSDNDYAQCRTMQVSYPDFAKICGYTEAKDIPYELWGQVVDTALKINLLVGCGNYTVLVGGDFHCDCDPQSLYPDYGFEEA